MRDKQRTGIPVTLVRVDKPGSMSESNIEIQGDIEPGTEVELESGTKRERIRVLGLSLHTSDTPAIRISCRGANWRISGFLLRAFIVGFHMLRWLAIGHWLRSLFLRRGRGAAAFAVDVYIAAWVAGVAVLLTRQWHDGPTLVHWPLVALALYRVFELLVVYFNILLFDRVRSLEQGEAYVIVSSARSVLISIVSYVELILCFALVYMAFGAEYFVGMDSAMTAQNALYFSMVTITTLGFGDLRPLTTTRTVSGIEAVLGVLFGVTIVARMLSWLPRVASIDDAQ